MHFVAAHPDQVLGNRGGPETGLADPSFVARCAEEALTQNPSLALRNT